MRRKLLTGRSRTMRGHGGLEVSESDLAALWPLFLNVSTQAARPSLSLLDVEVMIEQRETWKCNGKKPRILKDAEVEAIETWYESARARDPPAHRLSEIGRHAMKAKIGDAAPRFGRYTTKSGAIEARSNKPTDRRGRAAWNTIQAALGIQYREEGHIASPVKRPRCEPVGHAEASCAASCGGGGELANARVPEGPSAEGRLEYRSSSIGQGQLFDLKDFEPVVTSRAMPSATDVDSDALESLHCAQFTDGFEHPTQSMQTPYQRQRFCF